MLPSWTHVQIWIDGEWKILFIFSTSFKLLLGFETTTTKKTNNNSKNKNQTLIHPNSDSIRAATQFKYTVLDKKLHQFNTTEFQMSTPVMVEDTRHAVTWKRKHYVQGTTRHLPDAWGIEAWLFSLILHLKMKMFAPDISDRLCIVPRKGCRLYSKSKNLNILFPQMYVT